MGTFFFSFDDPSTLQRRQIVANWNSTSRTIIRPFGASDKKKPVEASTLAEFVTTLNKSMMIRNFIVRCKSFYLAFYMTWNSARPRKLLDTEIYSSERHKLCMNQTRRNIQRKKNQFHFNEHVNSIISTRNPLILASGIHNFCYRWVYNSRRIEIIKIVPQSCARHRTSYVKFVNPKLSFLPIHFIEYQLLRWIYHVWPYVDFHYLNCIELFKRRLTVHWILSLWIIF